MAKGKVKISGDALSGSVTHLLHRALQLALDFHTDAVGPAAITQRQYTVLTAASAGDGMTQNDLVRATGIDRSTLADLVARMLAKGLLVRERSTTDARANSVRLSEVGRQALDHGAKPAADADARLLAVLSPKKREAFLKTLTALAAVADDPAAIKAKNKSVKTVEKAKGGKARSRDDGATKAAKAKADKPAKTVEAEKKQKKQKKKSKDLIDA